MRIAVYDIEIAREVEEVGGWGAVRNGEAGISSLVIYDSASHRPHIYGPNIAFDGEEFIADGLGTLPRAAEHLNEVDVIVGFNNIAFDTPVFENVTGEAIHSPQYDILDEVWRALGNERHRGYRLNEIALRTLGKEKTNNGKSAPKLFKEGRLYELIDYNLNDVMLTVELCNFINENGYIIDVNGDQLELAPLGEHIG